MRVFSILLASFIFFGCTEKKVAADTEKVTDSASCKTTTAKKSKFQMYEMSEMAALMEQMYVENERIKETFTSGGEIGTYPVVFEKIYSAKMTDSTDNDAFFQAKAKAFLQHQKRIYSDPENARTHYEAAINACITCHEKKCGGPIARIKTLKLE